MKYELELKINEENKEDLLKLLSEYIGDLGRAKVFVENKKENLILKILSEDVSALRAAINSITNALKVFEKSKKIIQNNLEGEKNE